MTNWGNQGTGGAATRGRVGEYPTEQGTRVEGSCARCVAMAVSNWLRYSLVTGYLNAL